MSPALQVRPWRFASEPCPRVLGVTLHRPWSWAFFRGRQKERKNLENRHRGFPIIPPGTILALHNGAKWDAKAEAFIKGMLSACEGLGRSDCPSGALVGAVIVEETLRNGTGQGDLFARESPWNLNWGTGVWLKPERWLFAEPIPFRAGWFGAWILPAEFERRVIEIVESTPPLGE